MSFWCNDCGHQVLGSPPEGGPYCCPPCYIKRGERRMRDREAETLTLKLSRRLDGGLRVWSDDLPGLLLSGSEPHKVMADVWPAVETMLQAGAKEGR